MGASDPVPTEFLPAALADAATVARQHAAVSRMADLARVLDAVPDIIVVLNRQRQIVYANTTAVDHVRTHGGSPEVGLRWGEAIRCCHAVGGERCGTTRFCRTCGAAQALWRTRSERSALEQCHITQTSGNALDYLVSTARVTLDGEEFTVFTAVDIGDTVRREALEKSFFHDVLNTAFGIRGLVELMPTLPPAQRDGFMAMLAGLSDELIEEICSQRDLLAAENKGLVVRPASFDALAMLREAIAYHAGQPFAKGKELRLDPASSAFTTVSDKVLLRRVVGNMIKNALEASEPGETVTAGCAVRDGKAEFWVHNPAVMPEAVSLQVFSRSFSTKGAGRGLGTYGMKLLTERCLGGTVGFTSAAGRGTLFTARYPLTLASPA
ncbi:MAG: PAS domain-containing sensor histidine kinase [Elusimicrobia bacterium]|nr:PAS domain-containing sensor histidine kinase [Elusimicrobiota bacterium]